MGYTRTNPGDRGQATELYADEELALGGGDYSVLPGARLEVGPRGHLYETLGAVTRGPAKRMLTYKDLPPKEQALYLKYKKMSEQAARNSYLRKKSAFKAAIAEYERLKAKIANMNRVQVSGGLQSMLQRAPRALERATRGKGPMAQSPLAARLRATGFRAPGRKVATNVATSSTAALPAADSSAPVAPTSSDIDLGPRGSQGGAPSGSGMPMAHQMLPAIPPSTIAPLPELELEEAAKVDVASPGRRMPRGLILGAAVAALGAYAFWRSRRKKTPST